MKTYDWVLMLACLLVIAIFGLLLDVETPRVLRTMGLFAMGYASSSVVLHYIGEHK